MVSQFLRLTKFEQWKIVESNFEIMKVGKEYLLGEDEADDDGNHSTGILEDDDYVMTIHHHDDDNYEMSIEEDGKQDEKREGFNNNNAKVKGGKEGNRQVSPKEIVDILNFILSELNMQVS